MRLEILKPFTVLLKIPSTIETYKVIPMWFDLSHIAQDKLTAVQMLAFLHILWTSIFTLFNKPYMQNRIFIPTVFLCPQSPQRLSQQAVEYPLRQHEHLLR